MAQAFDIVYSDFVHLSIKGSRGFLSRLNDRFDIPGDAQTGALTVNLLTDTTATDITDGTMLTNDTNSTQVNLTLVDKAATLALTPQNWKASYTKPANLKKIAVNHANAIDVLAQAQVISDLVAATPAITETLTVGQVDFISETDAEARENLSKLSRVLTQCWSFYNTTDPMSFTILTTPIALGNLIAIKLIDVPVPQFDGNTNKWTYLGVPIFAIAGTSFGTAGNDALYIINANNYAFKMNSVGLHGGGLINASDGTRKWVTIGTYAHGVITQTSIGVIVNPGS